MPTTVLCVLGNELMGKREKPKGNRYQCHPEALVGEAVFISFLFVP